MPVVLLQMRNRWFALVLTCGLGLTASACAHSKIPGTEIDDSPENREIVQLVEEYKAAVERMDTDAIMALVSPEFFETNGNIDVGDDYDYKGLEANLKANFVQTKRIQLVLRLDDIQIESNTAFAELYYQIRAHHEYPTGLKWETGNDRTRLKFVRADDRWLIIAGL